MTELIKAMVGRRMVVARGTFKRGVMGRVIDVMANKVTSGSGITYYQIVAYCAIDGGGTIWVCVEDLDCGADKLVDADR